MTSTPATCSPLPPAGKGHGEKLTRKQESALAALLSCATIGQAATTAGIGERTLWRWLQRPSFQSQYRAARRQVVEAAVGRLQQATGEAVEALRRNLTCGVNSVEVQAAKAILEHATKAVELMDLIERVDALETQATKRGTHGFAA